MGNFEPADWIGESAAITSADDNGTADFDLIVCLSFGFLPFFPSIFHSIIFKYDLV